VAGPALKERRLEDRAGSANSGHLGRIALGFLAICIVSGFALSPFYSVIEAAGSVERLTGGVPWGSLLRGVHAWSGFGLLVASVAHLVEVWATGKDRRLPRGLWWASVLLLPIVVGALLGGFILRGDAEARAALGVWRGVFETIPLTGTVLSRLLLGGGDRPADLALHHAGTFSILLVVLTAAHGKRLLPDRRSATLAALLSVAFGGAFAPALGSDAASAAPASGVLLGPWYLLGFQGALASLPPPVAWIAPLALLVAIAWLRDADEFARRAIGVVGGIWAAVYAGFAVRLLLAVR
jgi:hypothetical protein